MSLLKKKSPLETKDGGAGETAVLDGAPSPAPAAAKKRKRRLWLLAIPALLCAAWALPKLLGGGAAVVPSGYVSAAAERRDIAQRVTGTGTLEPADSYSVTTLISGEVLEAAVEEGALVEKDQLLFSLDSSAAQNSANAAVIDVERSGNGYAQAQEALYPTATVSGVIKEVYVRDGESVQAGAKLCRIISDEDLTIDFLFTYDSANGMSVGQAATVYISGFAGTVSGTVSSISDASTVSDTGMKMRSVRVKAQNPGNVPDACTAQAVIGGNSSYGSASVTMAGSGTVFASGSGTIAGFTKLAGNTVARGERLCTVESEGNRTALKNARLSLESSRLTASTAQQGIERYTITAPIAGEVIERNVKAGDMVDGAGTGALALIYDLSYLKVKIPVNELDIAKVRVGQTVELTADAVPGQVFTGTVEKVSINGSTTSGFTTYPVTVVIREYGELKPGMNISATVLGETAENVLCIPLSAVSRGNTVLIPGEGALSADGTQVLDPSKGEERQVTIGRNDSVYIEISQGLSEGDRVIYAQTDPVTGG